jgi:hypothetical protein
MPRAKVGLRDGPLVNVYGDGVSKWLANLDIGAQYIYIYIPRQLAIIMTASENMGVWELRTSNNVLMAKGYSGRVYRLAYNIERITYFKVECQGRPIAIAYHTYRAMDVASQHLNATVT